MAKKAEQAGGKQSSYEAGGRIQARISDFGHGLRVFDGVRLVRIRSKDYTLLIMEDYFPLLGSVQGRVELVTDGELVNLGTIKGFYLHRDNEFALLIKEQLAEPADTEAEAGHAG